MQGNAATGRETAIELPGARQVHELEYRAPRLSAIIYARRRRRIYRVAAWVSLMLMVALTVPAAHGIATTPGPVTQRVAAGFDAVLNLIPSAQASTCGPGGCTSESFHDDDDGGDDADDGGDDDDDGGGSGSPADGSGGTGPSPPALGDGDGSGTVSAAEGSTQQAATGPDADAPPEGPAAADDDNDDGYAGRASGNHGRDDADDDSTDDANDDDDADDDRDDADHDNDVDDDRDDAYDDNDREDAWSSNRAKPDFADQEPAADSMERLRATAPVTVSDVPVAPPAPEPPKVEEVLDGEMRIAPIIRPLQYLTPEPEAEDSTL